MFFDRQKRPAESVEEQNKKKSTSNKKTPCAGISDETWTRPELIHWIKDCITNSPSLYHRAPPRHQLCKDMFCLKESELDSDQKKELAKNIKAQSTGELIEVKVSKPYSQFLANYTFLIVLHLERWWSFVKIVMHCIPIAALSLQSILSMHRATRSNMPAKTTCLRTCSKQGDDVTLSSTYLRKVLNRPHNLVITRFGARSASTPAKEFSITLTLSKGLYRQSVYEPSAKQMGNEPQGCVSNQKLTVS